MAPNLKLKRVTDQVVDFPDFSAPAQKILKLIQKKHRVALGLDHILEEDPDYRNVVIDFVNAPLFAFPRRLKTVSHAATVLGWTSVRNVVLSLALIDTFKGSPSKTSFNREGFWMHSFASGLAARNLARLIGYADIEEAFMAGFIHDIGKILLDYYVPTEYLRVLNIVTREDLLMRDVEQRILEVTNQEVGEWFAGQWKLPPNLISAIVHHHQPQEAEDQKDLVSIVHVADILVRAIEIGDAGDDKMPALDHEAWKYCGLNMRKLRQLMEQTASDIEKVDIFLNFI